MIKTAPWQTFDNPPTLTFNLEEMAPKLLYFGLLAFVATVAPAAAVCLDGNCLVNPLSRHLDCMPLPKPTPLIMKDGAHSGVHVEPADCSETGCTHQRAAPLPILHESRPIPTPTQAVLKDGNHGGMIFETVDHRGAMLVKQVNCTVETECVRLLCTRRQRKERVTIQKHAKPSDAVPDTRIHLDSTVGLDVARLLAPTPTTMLTSTAATTNMAASTTSVVM